LSGGLIEEFGIAPDLNLGIDGPVYQKTAQIIQRLGDVLAEMKARGKTVVPYVHGDTMTAMAAANAAYALEFASVHVEAGIRTLSPLRTVVADLQRTQDVAAYAAALTRREAWERGSIEP